MKVIEGGVPEKGQRVQTSNGPGTVAFVYGSKSTHVWRGEVVVDLDRGGREFFKPEELEVWTDQHREDG